MHIKLIGDLPVGSGALEEARQAARYLAKYVSKNVADERVPRLHRYEVAQGFQPRAGAAEGRLGRGRDRAGVRADGRRAATGVALVAAGGVAGAARVLVCLGWLTISALTAHRWAEETAQAQGLGPKVGRRSLGVGGAAARREGVRRARPGASAGVVELVEPAPAGADDDVIDDGGDDLLLAS